MIEFLQPLVDIVTSALPSVVQKKERDASAKLGAELFLIYTQFNEALVLGGHIVEELELYIDRMSRNIRDRPGYFPHAGEWVAEDVRQQLRNLVGIRDRIAHWKWELQVLDGAAINDLQFFLRSKTSALVALNRVIVDDERIPLRTTGVLIDDQGVVRAGDEYVEPSRGDLDRKYRQLYDELTDESASISERWNLEILATVERYLEIRKPREQLDKIRVSLEKIRTALEANFTISDILLRAGDPRGGRTGWDG